ncbi:hypothetical protein CYPRO_0591 [Cyclonatronum proteinivorum]|uniref:Uncharacterized protein n=1 Tax=Cyclonatronum proteinivorum TaxID=1457365 RepID=A0A345UHC4_9BACT|nr:hypothetical protein CYPRO_0591 [Cyclonatronum proteinivorum]
MKRSEAGGGGQLVHNIDKVRLRSFMVFVEEKN